MNTLCQAIESSSSFATRSFVLSFFLLSTGGSKPFLYLILIILRLLPFCPFIDHSLSVRPSVTVSVVAKLCFVYQCNSLITIVGTVDNLITSASSAPWQSEISLYSCHVIDRRCGALKLPRTTLESKPLCICQAPAL
jgi:hypothetical protein